MADVGKHNRRKVVKNTIDKSTELLCGSLRIDDLLRTLLSRGALKRNEVEKIKNAGIDADKVDAMLQILAINVQSYEIFMNALKEDRPDLYDDVKEIENKEIGQITQPTPTPVPPTPSSNNGTPSAQSDSKLIKYDVMISYQWDAQERMKLLKDKLEGAGLTVWMDITKIEGHINERMAEGVERSKAIILCFSQKYFESQNCHKEAAYADTQKKKIIPLKYESGYKPRGWLGLILGDILYYDVSSDKALNENIGAIVGAIFRQK